MCNHNIEAMENAGKILNRESNVFFNLLSAESNDGMMGEPLHGVAFRRIAVYGMCRRLLQL